MLAGAWGFPSYVLVGVALVSVTFRPVASIPEVSVFAIGAGLAPDKVPTLDLYGLFVLADGDDCTVLSGRLDRN